MLGDGIGGLAPQTVFPVGDQPSSVAVGDFNVDGASDLAVANSQTDDVSVLLNRSNEPPNQRPAAVDDAYTHYGSDTPLVRTAATGVLANDTDPNNSPLTVSPASGPARGSLVLNADGSFSYQPNEDFVGQDSFTYVASNGSADSNVATVTITVGAGCEGVQATITGTPNTDNLQGTAGADVIAGLGSGDLIGSAGGNDTVCGGSGIDVLLGGAGNDALRGGSGVDGLFGEAGNDSMRGGAGSDALLGGAGVDTVRGDAGSDLLSGGAGSPDTCEGDAGADILFPGHGCEQITGVP